MERREVEDGAQLEALRRRFEQAEAGVEAGSVYAFDDALLARPDEDERAAASHSTCPTPNASCSPPSVANGS
jgi:hypothetical protein